MVAYLMVGIPNSGKTTWARNMTEELEKIGVTCKTISYQDIDDAISKGLYDYYSYFATLKRINTEFVNQINDALESYDCVFIDTTNCLCRERRELIASLFPPKDSLLYVKVMNTPYEICVERNSKRTEETKTSREAMWAMYNEFSFPMEQEFGFMQNKFDKVCISEMGD